MRYWLATWTEAPPDEPIWMALEVEEDGSVPRLVEHFELGWTGTRDARSEESDSLLDEPFDPEDAQGDPNLSLREIPAETFAALWEAQVADPPQG
jgi:hypothetical protein